ncbi:hypothetical protein LCGC14_0389770 [marine sediment metagenome]|uniref:Uncharacterized protein n=1 Tax=marine sediment metagenome TaxID=412755 RepID=A0A0F9T027_9ZZZZ
MAYPTRARTFTKRQVEKRNCSKSELQQSILTTCIYATQAHGGCLYKPEVVECVIRTLLRYTDKETLVGVFGKVTTE